jgi:hypothetical protein
MDYTPTAGPAKAALREPKWNIRLVRDDADTPNENDTSAVIPTELTILAW